MYLLVTMPLSAFIALTLLPGLRLRQKKLGHWLHMTGKQYKLLQSVKRAHILREKAKGTTKLKRCLLITQHHPSCKDSLLFYTVLDPIHTFHLTANTPDLCNSRTGELQVQRNSRIWSFKLYKNSVHIQTSTWRVVYFYLKKLILENDIFEAQAIKTLLLEVTVKPPGFQFLPDNVFSESELPKITQASAADCPISRTLRAYFPQRADFPASRVLRRERSNAQQHLILCTNSKCVAIDTMPRSENVSCSLPCSCKEFPILHWVEQAIGIERGGLHPSALSHYWGLSPRSFVGIRG